jgi:unconventional prefoldin RPB5 interactor 1
MAKSVKDSFLDLERHRQLLEDNIEKLRKSLRHWQTWEAEYEGLKEEILAARPTPNREELVALARDYEGELVTKKEIEDILGASAPRTVAQVVNLLDRRIDYVEQNVKTVHKQIEAAENKLAAATVISIPDVRNEEGLPLTEIVEELDEEGNIISSHTSTPGSAKPQLLEVLQKAGVKNLPEQAPESKNTPVPFEKNVKASQEDPNSTKKGVEFSDNTKSGPEAEKSKTAKRIEEIMSIARQQDIRPTESPVIPTDESPEDAALRREMLQYGMSEVGAVVAELELEDGSDCTDEDYDRDGTSSTDDEDEFGRSTGSIVDTELRQRMIELEERLGVKMMENIGNKVSDYDIVKEGIGRIAISGQDESSTTDGGSNTPAKSQKKSQGEQSADSQTSTKKSVRFSDDLDIAPAPQPPVRVANKRTTITASIGDIVERTAPTPTSSPATPNNISRFKSVRAATPNAVNGPLAISSTSSTDPTLPLNPVSQSARKLFSTPIQFSPAGERVRLVPTGPAGKTTLAPTIVERDVPLNTSAAGPDEMDPQLLHQEVATEYHRMRNRMIQRQGGFLKEEEGEIVPFTEEEGGPKKMSRFKAARLARS